MRSYDKTTYGLVTFYSQIHLLMRSSSPSAHARHANRSAFSPPGISAFSRAKWLAFIIVKDAATTFCMDCVKQLETATGVNVFICKGRQDVAMTGLGITPAH